MISVIIVGILVLIAYYILSNVVSLLKNIEKAKKSGLPYVVCPAYQLNIIWALTGRRFISRYAKDHPNSQFTRKYLAPMLPGWEWPYGYAPFEEHGDTFLAVFPGGVQLSTASREVVNQITTRRDDFQKPTWMYSRIDMFGRNVVTTEGTEWKFHRKITSPSFSEKNNFMVFHETIRQGRELLKKWTGEDGKGNVTVEDISSDTMRLSLYVISKAGFGIPLYWPGENPNADLVEPLSEDATFQHTLPFKDALADVLHYAIMIILLPTWILKRLPFEVAKKAYTSYLEYTAYMDELFSTKKKEAIAGEKAEGMDIMGALVKNSYSPENRMANGKSKPATDDLERQRLTDREILGNAFVFMLAGHETSAGALHYGLLFLAMHPASQRRLQADIDKIFGNRTVEEWDYAKDINSMHSSMIGAVMHEELRVVPPVISIPKQCPADREQMLMVDGKKVVLPKGCLVNLSAASLHRNPKYWPSLGPSKVTNATNDLNDFVPERWLLKQDNSTEADTEMGPSADNGQDHLFFPLKSSYIPFSDGARSCLGKRFAQVEIMVLLAMIFQKFSIELAVDELASDDAVERMNDEERRDIYKKQAHVARKIIEEKSEPRVTIQIRNAFVPIRLVPRGKERFLQLFEDIRDD